MITITSTADNASAATASSALRVTALSCDLNITGQSPLSAESNGVLLLRRLLGFSGPALIDGLGSGLNYSAGDLQRFVDGRQYKGLESAPTALMSGPIVWRLMQSFGNVELLGGITLPANAPLQTAAAIRADINAKCGTSF